MDRYAGYRRLGIDWASPGVLRVTIDNPGRANALDAAGHGEITRIWRDADADERVRAVLVTGAGRTFSAGRDLDWVRELADDPPARAAGLRDARELVANLVDFGKPLVSAVRGVAVGARSQPPGHGRRPRRRGGTRRTGCRHGGHKSGHAVVGRDTDRERTVQGCPER